MTSGASCNQCGEPTVDDGNIPRVPCLNCGSTSRRFDEHIRETACAEEFMRIRADHRNGGPNIVRKVYAGDDLHRKTGRWSGFYRLIDKANNQYEERIWDRETGKMLMEKSEKLTDHQKPRNPVR